MGCDTALYVGWVLIPPSTKSIVSDVMLIMIGKIQEGRFGGDRGQTVRTVAFEGDDVLAVGGVLACSGALDKGCQY